MTIDDRILTVDEKRIQRKREYWKINQWAKIARKTVYRLVHNAAFDTFLVYQRTKTQHSNIHCVSKQTPTFYILNNFA